MDVYNNFCKKRATGNHKPQKCTPSRLSAYKLGLIGAFKNAKAEIHDRKLLHADNWIIAQSVYWPTLICIGFIGQAIICPGLHPEIDV